MLTGDIISYYAKVWSLKNEAYAEALKTAVPLMSTWGCLQNESISIDSHIKINAAEINIYEYTACYKNGFGLYNSFPSIWKFYRLF